LTRQKTSRGSPHLSVSYAAVVGGVRHRRRQDSSVIGLLAPDVSDGAEVIKK
jgi:hypothetical protein